MHSYLSSLKQSEAGAAIAASETTINMAAGIMIMVSAVAVEAIGFGYFFTILATLNAAAMLYSFDAIVAKRRAADGLQTLDVPDVENTHTSTTLVRACCSASAANVMTTS